MWLAPSEGLLLNRINFDAYNRKVGIPEKIELEDSEVAELEAFKKRVIYKEVFGAEEEDQVFTKWCEKHREYIKKDRKERMEKETKITEEPTK